MTQGDHAWSLAPYDHNLRASQPPTKSIIIITINIIHKNWLKDQGDIQ